MLLISLQLGLIMKLTGGNIWVLTEVIVRGTSVELMLVQLG